MSKRLSFPTLMIAVLTACGGGGSSGASAANPAAVAEAKQIWDSRCATCHGAGGDGTGPGAVALNPKPRSFRDMQWHVTTTNDRIKQVMIEGGKAVGLSEMMAPNPDLAGKPEVVEELVRLIRGFKP